MVKLPATSCRLLHLFVSFAAIAASLSAPPGCRYPTVSLDQRPRTYRVKHYDGILDRWTRSGKVIRHFDTNLRVHATYWSWEFTWAYSVKWAHDFRLPKSKAETTRAGMLRDKLKYNEFYVAATTQEPDWNDLDDKESIWQISLIVDKKTHVRPVDVEEIDTITEIQRSFFPYTGIFYKAYKVRFPILLGDGKKVVPAGASRFTLQFAGPKGLLRLTWKLR